MVSNETYPYLRFQYVDIVANAFITTLLKLWAKIIFSHGHVLGLQERKGDKGASGIIT